jgi:hypothetical protein
MGDENIARRQCYLLVLETKVHWIQSRRPKLVKENKVMGQTQCHRGHVESVDQAKGQMRGRNWTFIDSTVRLSRP